MVTSQRAQSLTGWCHSDKTNLISAKCHQTRGTLQIDWVYSEVSSGFRAVNVIDMLLCGLYAWLVQWLLVENEQHKFKKRYM